MFSFLPANIPASQQYVLHRFPELRKFLWLQHVFSGAGVGFLQFEVRMGSVSLGCAPIPDVPEQGAVGLGLTCAQTTRGDLGLITDSSFPHKNAADIRLCGV